MVTRSQSGGGRVLRSAAKKPAAKSPAPAPKKKAAPKKNSPPRSPNQKAAAVIAGGVAAAVRVAVKKAKSPSQARAGAKRGAKAAGGTPEQAKNAGEAAAAAKADGHAVGNGKELRVPAKTNAAVVEAAVGAVLGTKSPVAIKAAAAKANIKLPGAGKSPAKAKSPAKSPPKVNVKAAFKNSKKVADKLRKAIAKGQNEYVKAVAQEIVKSAQKAVKSASKKKAKKSASKASPKRQRSPVARTKSRVVPVTSGVIPVYSQDDMAQMIWADSHRQVATTVQIEKNGKPVGQPFEASVRDPRYAERNLNELERRAEKTGREDLEILHQNARYMREDNMAPDAVKYREMMAERRKLAKAARKKGQCLDKWVWRRVTLKEGKEKGSTMVKVPIERELVTYTHINGKVSKGAKCMAVCAPGQFRRDFDKRCTTFDRLPRCPDHSHRVLAKLETKAGNAVWGSKCVALKEGAKSENVARRRVHYKHVDKEKIKPRPPAIDRAQRKRMVKKALDTRFENIALHGGR